VPAAMGPPDDPATMKHTLAAIRAAAGKIGSPMWPHGLNVVTFAPKQSGVFALCKAVTIHVVREGDTLACDIEREFNPGSLLTLVLLAGLHYITRSVLTTIGVLAVIALGTMLAWRSGREKGEEWLAEVLFEAAEALPQPAGDKRLGPPAAPDAS